MSLCAHIKAYITTLLQSLLDQISKAYEGKNKIDKKELVWRLKLM